MTCHYLPSFTPILNYTLWLQNDNCVNNFPKPVSEILQTQTDMLCPICVQYRTLQLVEYYLHKMLMCLGKKLTRIYYLRRPPPMGTFINSRFGKTFFSSALRKC